MATLSNHKFGSAGVGMDVWTDPGDLPNSGLTLAYNMYIDGTNLKTRPGIVGLLTTPMSYPIYTPTPYVKSDGTEWIIFCSGPPSSTTGGKIYQVQNTGGTATEILDAGNGNVSFNINAEAFRVAVCGGYAYMVWGGSIYRTNLSSAAASPIQALNPPVVAPNVSLSNIPLDPLTTVTGWTADTIATNWAYTDIVISSGSSYQVTSALRPFQQTDAGATLTITGGTGFTTGAHTISSVSADGVATLATSAGTVNSTGGTGTLPQLTVASNMIPNGQSDLESYSGPYGGTPHQNVPIGDIVGKSWVSTNDNSGCLAAANGYWAPNYLGSFNSNLSSVANVWFALDDPSVGFTSLTAFYNSGPTVPLQVPLLADSPSNYRSVNQFYVSYNYFTTDTTSKQGLNVTLNAYSDTAASVLIGTASDTFIPVYSNQSTKQVHGVVLSFPGLAVPIKSIVLTIQGAATNVNATAFGNHYGFPCMANVSITPIATGTNGGLQFGNTFAEQNPGILINHGEPAGPFFGAIAGERIMKDYGSSNLQNWSLSPVITFNLLPAPGSQLTLQDLVSDGLSMSLVLRQNGSTTEYIAPLTVSSDGTYMTTDVSAYIPISIYSDFEYMYLQFNSNINTGTSTPSLFVITSITQAGNLPISQSGLTFAPATYIVEELNDFGDATYTDPLESSGGPISNEVQPTAVFAVGNIKLPSAVNSNTTALAVFRGGLTFNDGLYRLIATVPLTSDYVEPVSYSDLVVGSTTTHVSSVARPFVSGDVGKILYILAGTGFNDGPLTVNSVSGGVAVLSASAGIASSTGGIAQLGGDTLNRDLQNPYVTWDHSTMTLTDNTPDSFLNFALTLQYGRDLPPTNCTCITSHQNRIWAASGQVISGSWDLTADAQNGIYFTNVDLSTDPYAQTKGVTFSVGYGDNDNIQSLLSANSSLLILKHRSAAIVDGYDPTNFVCQSYLTSAGLGNVASRAAVVCGNVSKVWFLGPDNVYEFDGNVTNPKGTPIQPLLHPNGYDGGVTIPTTLFSKSAMFYYDQRLFLLAPVSGGTQNSTCYVFDFRNGCWSQWGISMTSGASLTGSSDGDGAYMGGYDGQLYTFAPGGDRSLPTSYPEGIPYTGISRGMGEEQQTFSPTGEVGMNFIEPNKASRIYIMGKAPANTQITLFCYADDNESVEYSTPFTVSGKFVVQSFVRGVEGNQIFVGVSGLATSQVTIRAFGAEVEKRKVPR